MIKRSFVLLFAFVLVMMLCGCDFFGLSDEKKELKKQYELSAKSEAVSYIKNKYNIVPKVLKSEAETDRYSLGPLFLTGEVIVTLKYKGKEFSVKYDENGDNKIVGDTYQHDIISKDYISEVSKIFNKKPYNYILSLNGIGYITKYFYDYYDGSNLEIFYPSSFTLFYTGDIDLSGINVLNYPIFANSNGTIINYSSLDDYKKAVNLSYSRRYREYGGVLRDSLYIKDAIVLSGNKQKYYNYSLNRNKDVVVYSISEYDDINIMQYNDVEEYSFSGNGKCDNRIALSKGYSIRDVHDSLIVYIPLKKIKSYYKYFSKIETINKGHVNYTCKSEDELFDGKTAISTIVGDYLYTAIPVSNCRVVEFVVCGN